MDIGKLKEEVFKANMDLQRRGLITLTWGNVSGIDRAEGVLVIKPSGVPYEELSPEKMALVSMADGKPLKGSLKPSSDTPTHLELYRAYASLGGVVHTHSTYATAFAQSLKSVPALGTTHADGFHGAIPTTRRMSSKEIQGDYERNTGLLIIETLKELAFEEVLHMPGILVAQHGPFTWGASPEKAVESAIVLEEVAKMASITLALNPGAAKGISQELLDKHFLRKHGKNAYYGQG